jgi:hypothetical protein
MLSVRISQRGFTRNTRFTLPEQILMDRRPTLVKYAGALRARGKGAREIHTELLKANTERCCPPLTNARDLDGLKRIAAWAATKPAGTTKHVTMSEADAEAFAAAVTLIEDYPWSGIASNNARIVAYAILQLMQEHGRVSDIAAACRDIAEVVGLSFTTTAKALRRLCGIRKDRRADVPVLFTRTIDQRRIQSEEQLAVESHAYSYKLQGAESAHTYSHVGKDSSSNTVRVVCASFAPLLSTVSHDAFRMRGKGLTRSAALILAALPCATARAIAAATHLSLRTVRNALAALKAEGLIEKKEKNTCWTRTCETLDTVAERRGTAGASEKQRKMHALQREAYGARLVKSTGRKDGTVYTLRRPKEEEQGPPDPVWGEQPDDWYRDAA